MKNDQNEINNRNKNKEGKERGIKMDTQQMFQELDRLYAQGKLDEAEEKMMGWMKEGFREQKPLPDDVQ